MLHWQKILRRGDVGPVGPLTRAKHLRASLEFKPHSMYSAD
jgi:hypothetical protein